MKSNKGLLAHVEACKNVLITGHMDPDGDSIGAIMALHHLFKSLNIPSTCVVDGTLPRRLQFLDPQNVILNAAHANINKSFSHVFACDSSSEARLGKSAMYLKKSTVVNIDHHVDNTYFGQYNFINPQASSTCEIIAKEFHNAIHLPKHTHEALAAGILYDTGGLKHPNVTPECLFMLYRARKSGVEVGKLMKNLFGTISKEGIQILGDTLGNIEYAIDGRLAWAVMAGTKEQKQLEVTQKAVEELMGIEGVEVGILFAQKKGETKVSFRCKSDFPVHKIAAIWGGGGHQKAAGATVEISLEKAVPQIISRVVDKLHEWDHQSSQASRPHLQ